MCVCGGGGGGHACVHAYVCAYVRTYVHDSVLHTENVARRGETESSQNVRVPKM